MKNKNEPTLFRRLPHPAGLLSVLPSQPAFGALRRLSRSAAALLLLVTLSASLQAGIVFNNGFENGSSEWGTSGAWSPTPSNANVSISSVSREGSNSVKFLPVPNENSTIRSEFTVRNELGWFDWGTEYWQGFSMRVIEPTDGYSIVFQHHSVPQSWDSGYAAGPNSFTIRTIDGNLEFRTSTNDSNVNVTPPQASATWGTESYAMPLTLNTWYDVVLNFRYAADSTGFIKVWVNGTKVIDITGPTVYNKDLSGAQRQDYQYQKIGLYYGPNNWSVGGEIQYDAFRIWEGAGGSYADVAPGGGATSPAAPSSLTATAVSSSQVNLSWADNSGNETGFEVDRATNSSFSSGLVTNAYTTGANPSMPVAAGGLSPSTTYYFRSRATNAVGDSANSNTASATTSASTVHTFSPTQDAYLQGSTRQNTSELRVEAGNRIAYLQFNITGLSGTVSNVKLRLTCAGDPGNGTVRVAKGNSNGWTETNLTTTNAPTSTGNVGSHTGAFALGTTYEWTLSGALTGTGTYSFIVTMDAGGNDAWFNSDEASVAANLKPQLVITTN